MKRTVPTAHMRSATTKPTMLMTFEFGVEAWEPEELSVVDLVKVEPQYQRATT